MLEIKVHVIGDSPDKNRTITTELTIANQWIWTSLIAKYVSHREAQTISLACTKVIKRNTISHSDYYKALHNSIPLFLWPFNHKTQKYEHLRIFSEYLMWLMKWELRTCKKRNPTYKIVPCSNLFYNITVWYIMLHWVNFLDIHCNPVIELFPLSIVFQVSW